MNIFPPLAIIESTVQRKHVEHIVRSFVLLLAKNGDVPPRASVPPNGTPTHIVVAARQNKKYGTIVVPPGADIASRYIGKFAPRSDDHPLGGPASSDADEEQNTPSPIPLI